MIEQKTFNLNLTNKEKTELEQRNGGRNFFIGLGREEWEKWNDKTNLIVANDIPQGSVLFLNHTIHYQAKKLY